MAIHKLLLKHPDLNFATYLGGGSVTEVLTPVGVLLNSLVSLAIKKLFLKCQLEMPYGVRDLFPIKSNPSILLGKLKDGLVFDMTKGLLSENDDMVLVNEVDDIRVLAAKNVGIAARQGDITLSCRDKFQVSGREKTAIASPLINLTAEPKLVGAPDCGIQITAKEGDLEFMTKDSGTIKIGHDPGLGGGKSPELSIASNGKVKLADSLRIFG